MNLGLYDLTFGLNDSRYRRFLGSDTHTTAAYGHLDFESK